MTCDRPRLKTGSSRVPRATITSPAACLSHALRPSILHMSVALTETEVKGLRDLYEFEPDPMDGDACEVIRAGNQRNLLRHAEADGLRLVAWMAKYCDPGEDPVKVLVRLFGDAGYEIDPADVNWAYGENIGENIEDDESEG